MYLHVCPVCAHRNPGGSRFCNECGAPLQLRFCAACHAAADVLDLQCSACGARLPQIALSDAADLPPAFSDGAQAPAAAGVDHDATAPRAQRPASDDREAPTRTESLARAPAQAPSARAANVTSHAAAGNPLDPLTAPPFVPQGDPYGDGRGDAHGPIDESAARFAAAKTASIIERLYGKSARADPEPPRPSSEPQPAYESPAAHASQPVYGSQPVHESQPVDESQAVSQPAYEAQPAYELQPAFGPQSASEPQPAPRRRVRALGPILIGAALVGLFFAIPSDEPPPFAGRTPPPAANTPEAPAAADVVPAALAPSAVPADRETAPQRMGGGTIKWQPEAGALAGTVAPPGSGVPPAASMNAVAQGRTEATATRPAPNAEKMPRPRAATSRAPGAAPAVPSAPAKPAQVTPCTPQVAALGLCAPAQ